MELEGKFKLEKSINDKLIDMLLCFAVQKAYICNYVRSGLKSNVEYKCDKCPLKNLNKNCVWCGISVSVNVYIRTYNSYNEKSILLNESCNFTVWIQSRTINCDTHISLNGYTVTVIETQCLFIEKAVYKSDKASSCIIIVIY